MQSVIYNELTNTYKVTNEDGTFDTYTPQQYVETFGNVPVVEEDVADVPEKTIYPNPSTKGAPTEPVAPTEPDLSNTVVVNQADLDEMVSYTIPESLSEDDLAGLNANLPEGVLPAVAGDVLLLDKNHYLLNSN